MILKDNPLAYWRLDETEGQIGTQHRAGAQATGEAGLEEPAGRADGAGPGGAGRRARQSRNRVRPPAAVPPGKLDKVIVAGTTPVGEQDFTAESPPAVLEVNKP